MQDAPLPLDLLQEGSGSHCRGIMAMWIAAAWGVGTPRSFFSGARVQDLTAISCRHGPCRQVAAWTHSSAARALAAR